MIIVFSLYLLIYIFLPNYIDLNSNIIFGTLLHSKHFQILLLSIPIIYILKYIKKIYIRNIFYIILFFLLFSLLIFGFFGLPDISKFWQNFFNLFYFQIGIIFLYTFYYGFGVLFNFDKNQIKVLFSDKFSNRLYFYSIIFLIFLFNFILKIYFSINLSIDTDEAYTWMVIEGYNKYGIYNITPSGEYYNQTNIFHIMSTYFYNFFYNLGFDKTFSLRSFNIFYSTFLFIPFFIILRKIIGEKISLLVLFFFMTNWYFLILQFTARSYVTFFFFFFFSIIFLFYSYSLLQKSKYLSSILYFFFSLVFGIYNFFDGHILGFYHYIFILFIICGYEFLNNPKKFYKIYITFSLFILFLFIYVYIYKYTYIVFILQAFNPFLKTDILFHGGNIFSYLGIIGNLLFIISFIFIFKLKIKNLNILLLSLLIIIFFHIYLYSDRLWFFKYLVGVYTFFSIFVCILLFFLWKNNKMLLYFFGFVIIFSNFIYYNKIYKDNISGWVMNYKEDKKDFLSYCFLNIYTTILTDNPSLLYYYSPNNTFNIFALKPKDLGEYIYDNNGFKYKYLPNIKVIDNIDSLKKLSGKNKKLCFLLSHNVYDGMHRFGNEDFFNYVMDNSIIIENKKIIQNLYDISYFNAPNNNNGTILILNI